MSEQNKTPGRGGVGHGGRMALASGEKAKDFGKTMQTLLSYLQPHRSKVILVVIFAMLSTVFTIVGPKLLGKATTKLAEGLLAWYAQTGLLTDFAYIGRIIVTLVILYVISAVFSYLQASIMTSVSMDVTYNLRKNISEKMNRIPLNYYDTRTHGEVLSRVTNDVDLVSQTLNQSLTQIITSVTNIIGILIMMLSISWLMTLAALVVIPASLAIVGVVINRSQIYFRAQQISLGEINGHIEEMYGGHTIVQAFNGKKNRSPNLKRLMRNCTIPLSVRSSFPVSCSRSWGASVMPDMSW
jgi:ATP-binding cassette subfamily B protein